MTARWIVYSYEGQTKGGWHKFSVCRDDGTRSSDETHECLCDVSGPDEESARRKAQTLADLLNRAEAIAGPMTTKENQP